MLLVAAGVLASLVGPTFGQPVWWDEAEYLIHGRHLALGTPETGYFPGRPPLLSWIVAAFHTVGLGETALRIAMLSCVLGSVFLIHRIGRQLVGPSGAVIGALLFSVFYVPVFYGARILTDVPQVFLVLLSLWLALDRRAGVAALFVPALALAIAMRFSAALMLPVLLAAYLGTHGPGVLRGRAMRLALAAGATGIMGYLALSLVRGDSTLGLLRRWRFLVRIRPDKIGLRLGQQLDFLSESLGWLLLGLSLLGLAGLVWQSWQSWQGWQGLHARKTERLALASSAGVLLPCWVLLSLVFYGVILKRNPATDRYLVGAMPAFFLAIGATPDLLLRVWPRLDARLPLLASALILAHAGVRLHPRTDAMIERASTTFGALAVAGRYVQEHSEPDDLVFSASVPQLTYYSRRSTHPFPGDEEAYREALASQRPRFLVVSNAHPAPPWFRTSNPGAMGFGTGIQIEAHGSRAVIYRHDGDWSAVLSATGR